MSGTSWDYESFPTPSELVAALADRFRDHMDEPIKVEMAESDTTLVRLKIHVGDGPTITVYEEGMQ